MSWLKVTPDAAAGPPGVGAPVPPARMPSRDDEEPEPHAGILGSVSAPASPLGATQSRAWERP